jgi:hypothetical protein
MSGRSDPLFRFCCSRSSSGSRRLRRICSCTAAWFCALFTRPRNIASGPFLCSSCWNKFLLGCWPLPCPLSAVCGPASRRSGRKHVCRIPASTLREFLHMCASSESRNLGSCWSAICAASYPRIAPTSRATRTQDAHTHTEPAAQHAHKTRTRTQNQEDGQG